MEIVFSYAKRNLFSNNTLLNKIKKEAPTSKSRGVLPCVDNISQNNNNVNNDTSSTKYSMQEDIKNTQGLDNSSFSLDANAKRYEDLLKLKKYYYGKYKVPNSDLFIFGGIKPLSPTSCNRYKKNACKKANLRPITLHQFRHSHATLLLSNGIMLNEVSRRLGHSKTSTTLNVYCHTSLEQEKKSIKTLNFLRFNLFALESNFNIIKSIFKHFFNV